MKLDAKRLNMVLLGLLGLAVIVLFGSIYLANSILKSKSKAVADAYRSTLVAEEKQRLLSRAQAGIEKYKELAEVANSIVPQDKDQAQTVREIVNIASAHGISLGEITFPNSSLGATGAAGATDGQLKAVPGIGGVFSLQITVRSDKDKPAPFTSFINFLAALEQNRRTALVTGISLEPDDKNASRVNFTLTVNEYIKP